MRVLIVHISDFHIHSEMPSAGDARFMQMRKSLANLDDYEAVFILFTGDAAFSGKAEEYERVEPLFSRMEEVLLEGYEGKTATLVVPGNHDLDLPKDVAEDEMTRLHGKPIWGDFEQIANDQKGRMVNYNAWAANRDCSFGDAQVASKEVCAGKGKNDATLRFSLINTVPISIWTTTTDKQFHYIDERSISLIAREEDSDLHIALAHHSPEWFAETVKRPLLEAFQSYVDILLLGHDHVAGSYERIEDDGSLLVLPGGKCDFAAGGDFTFSSIELDMDKYPYDAVVTIHRWQAQCQRFDSNVKPVRQIVPKRGAPVPNTAFLEQIGAAVGSSLLSAPFMDYFVFPPLMGATDLDTCESGRIDGFDDFFSVVERERCICVKGGGNAGKSTFARAVYLQSLRRGYVPILLSPDESQPSIRIMLKNLIEGQYGDSGNALARYNQLDKSRKLLVIDDFDRLHKKKDDVRYLDELLEQIGTIVLIARDEPDFNAVEPMKRQLGFEGSAAVYTMGPFVKSKRDKLVQNVCEIEGASIDVRDRLTNVVDRVVSGHRGMFDMSPDFIIHYAKYLLAHPEAMSVNDIIPMGQLYEANIEETVRKALSKSGRGPRARFAQTVMVVLEEIAYEMHSHKQPSITQERVSQITAEYCEEHALELDINLFVDTARQSGLLEIDQAGRLRFRSINQLAFFAARRIQRSTSQGELGEELEYLLDNICFEINERILLFLAYLRDNDELPYELCDRLNSMLSSEAAFDFESKALSFLAEPADSIAKIASREDDEKRSKFADENESKFARRESFEYSDIYDYDEAEAMRTGYAMIKALKYLQMLGRSYVAQYVRTDRTTKEFMRESLFEGPSRILGKTMDRLGEHFEEIADALYADLNEIAQEESDVQPFDRDDVAKFLRTFSCVMCVSVYDTIAYSCAESDTVGFLCEYDCDDSSARVLKVCMKENALDSKEFIDAICNAGADCKDQGLERTLLRLVANKHIVTHPNIGHRDIDRIAQHLFGSSKAKKNYIAGRIGALTSARTDKE